MTQTQIENKRLVEKYPFLRPRNRWTGEPVADYDYSFTELDDMPTGWRKAFGEQMCEELLAEVPYTKDPEHYRILQIKEKFGELRWYDAGGTERTGQIIQRYAVRSARTCIACGAPATEISVNWVSPYCDVCAHGIQYESFVPIDIWFAKQESDDDKEGEL